MPGLRGASPCQGRGLLPRPWRRAARCEFTGRSFSSSIPMRVPNYSLDGQFFLYAVPFPYDSEGHVEAMAGRSRHNPQWCRPTFWCRSDGSHKACDLMTRHRSSHPRRWPGRRTQHCQWCRPTFWCRSDGSHRACYLGNLTRHRSSHPRRWPGRSSQDPRWCRPTSGCRPRPGSNLAPLRPRART